MKIKTSELTDAALDWAVAKCEGYECNFDDEVSGPWLVPQEGYLHDEKPLVSFRPSTNWAQGGPIIEREKIRISPNLNGTWSAQIRHTTAHHLVDHPVLAGWTNKHGPTPLIAAMHCLVASRLSEEVEVPDELV